ncbi:DUF1294 domain-containing protein [Nocardioides oleivorans]|uniref:DUF1294 domain-containing protein n=1 Tax=Nocardioides oleivorans TaxID=273676 RepID=A0A4Q2RXD7_9ACTN|nr:cold shock and DUF1294 domain-containing protein [Nocardioides oleivorans]RYB93921.1 DUF1294 domain-containing protein [Nocardioides oleivorans]
MADEIGSGRGVLEEWNDERGFGFIVPADGGSRVFVHVSAFPRGRRPVAGSEVSYAEGRDERGRRRADRVAVVGARRSGAPHPRGTVPALAVVGVLVVVLAILTQRGDLHALVPIVYAVMSLATFATYGADKAAARAGRWRTPESTLHAMALLGGWPGALVARRLHRHKTRKQPFVTVLWLTVVVNCAAVGWLALGKPLP